MQSILLPQAVTSMLPVLISQLVVVLKDTAIGYVITFLEMVRQGVQLGAAYGNLLPALIVIAILMISVNFALSTFRGMAGKPAAPVASRADSAGRRGDRSRRVRPAPAWPQAGPGARLARPPRSASSGADRVPPRTYGGQVVRAGLQPRPAGTRGTGAPRQCAPTS